MKNKLKLVIIVLSIFLLTGCNVEYNIHLGKDKIEEQFYLIETKEKADKNYKEQGEDYYANLLVEMERGYEYYQRQLINKDDSNYAYRYEEQFKYNEFDLASLSNTCYEDFTLTKDNNRIILRTSNEVLCYDYYEQLDKITITMTTDYEVIKTNADLSKNGKYTWVINKNNKDNKSIYIELKNDLVSKNIVNYIIFGGLTILVIGGLIYLKKKKGK